MKSEIVFTLRNYINILTFFFPPLVQIEDELFNPDYVEVDRIMDFARSTDDRGEVTEDHCIRGRRLRQAYVCRRRMIMES